jgi:hypothetical protein
MRSKLRDFEISTNILSMETIRDVQISLMLSRWARTRTWQKYLLRCCSFSCPCTRSCSAHSDPARRSHRLVQLHRGTLVTHLCLTGERKKTNVSRYFQRNIIMSQFQAYRFQINCTGFTRWGLVETRHPNNRVTEKPRLQAHQQKG